MRNGKNGQPILGQGKHRQEMMRAKAITHIEKGRIECSGSAGEWMLSQDFGYLAAKGSLEVSCLGIELWFTNRQSLVFP